MIRWADGQMIRCPLPITQTVVEYWFRNLPEG